MKTEQNKNTHVPLIRKGVQFNILAESPSETATALQVVCFFDFQKNQHYEGGTYAVNEHFGGEIHQLRKDGIFSGARLETLLLNPSSNQIPAHQLLLIGMGDPAELDLDLFKILGYTAVMEAIKIGVKDFCFAPSLKDAGIAMSFAKTDVSKTLAQGMFKALDAAAVLSAKKLIRPVALTEINLLAGQAQSANAYKGLQLAFD